MDTVKSILSSRGVQAAVVGIGVAAAMKYTENNRRNSDTCEIFKKKLDDEDETIPVLYEGEKLNQARVIWFQSPPDVVILHQFPRGRNVLSLSPFPIKLETFLRIHNIKYTNDFMFPYSPDTQKSPWITINGEEISDSQLIIEYLARKFGIDLSYKLPPKERGIALSFRHLLEQHFYWILMVERYVDQEARHLKDIVQKSCEDDDEHAKIFECYRRKAVKKMTTQTYNQGMGRLPRGELQKMGIEDLQAISSYLSNKTYVMGGDSPTDIDLVLFGFMCSIIYASPQDSPFKTCVEKRLTNLLHHMKNMKAKFFPDWESIINQPVIPKIEQGKDSDPKPQTESPAKETQTKDTNEKSDKMADQPAKPQPQQEKATKQAEDKNQAPVKRFTQAEKLQTPTRKTSQPGTPGRKISTLSNGTENGAKGVTNGSETPKQRPATLTTSAASPARRSSTPKVPQSSSKVTDGSKSGAISPQSPISPISPISPAASKSFLSSRKASNSSSSFSQSSKAKVITNGASNVLKSLMGKKKN